MVRIRFLNFGYIYTPVRTRRFQLFLKGLYMTSNSTTTCLKTNIKPVRLYSQKIVQFKCCDIAGQPLLWRRNQRIYFRSNTWRRLSTYPGSFLRRKEILILIFAGLSGGILYGWSKKFENDKRDREMEELDGLIKIAQESHKKGKNYDKAVQLYKDALQQVKKLIDSETQSHRRMSTLTTKFVFITDQVANLLHNLRKLDEAEDYYIQTLEALISHGVKKDDDAVIEISLKLASIYAEQERHELAESGFTWCVSNARRKMNEHKKFDINSAALLGMCIEGYGRYHIAQGNANKAISLFTEALEISKKLLEAKHPQVIQLLNNLAVAYREAGDTEQAMTLFRETIDLAKEIMPGDLWAFHFNYANTLVQSGDLENARLEYQKAIEMCQNENIRSVMQDRMSTHLKDT